MNGIRVILQEESYTSKASFFDNDEIPIYNKNKPVNYKFSGTRVKRGLYKTGTGLSVNADINGSLNILRKYLKCNSDAII
jgi:transposase